MSLDMKQLIQWPCLALLFKFQANFENRVTKGKQFFKSYSVQSDLSYQASCFKQPQTPYNFV